jgi:hypothetical protein
VVEQSSVNSISRWSLVFQPTPTINNLAVQRLKRRETTSDDMNNIFTACRATMVRGPLMKGFISELAEGLGFHRKTVSKQWNQMAQKLATLLDNQDEESHHHIIRENAHILFGTGHSSRRKANISTTKMSWRLPWKHSL